MNYIVHKIVLFAVAVRMVEDVPSGKCPLCDEESYFREAQNWDIALVI